MKFIEGQLFDLSKQELPRPRYLVYYTAELKGGQIRDRLILVDTTSFADYESWNKAGQPISDDLPARYGRPQQRRYANVESPKEHLKPLDKEATAEFFNRLRVEIHDVIWGGGGTTNNEVFVYIVKLLLCKIFDEKESEPNAEFRFQRRGDAKEPEPPPSVTARMNELYREAETAYLALPEPSSGPAFDPTRIAANKIAYVVGRLEGVSVTENVHQGDLLGEFFEQIVSQDFTQSKGQFFTPTKIVRFMLDLANAGEHAEQTMLKDRDNLGRPRLPFVIDPSAGSGTFLIEYMKTVTERLGRQKNASTFPARIRDIHRVWFANGAVNTWAKDFIFGIENNYDLGLASKVNMVLHGDGSMNTWIESGLMPFDDYWVDGRNNVLGIRKDPEPGYAVPKNEQFDFVISNPPFSLKMSDDEKNRVRTAFVHASSLSERIFVERWYQLLKPGGRFCCILPEAILDTSTK